jgi:hypothetical protein
MITRQVANPAETADGNMDVRQELTWHRPSC